MAPRRDGTAVAWSGGQTICASRCIYQVFGLWINHLFTFTGSYKSAQTFLQLHQSRSHRCPFTVNVLGNFSDNDLEGISGKTRPLLEGDFSAGELGWLNVAAPRISYLNTRVTLQPPPLCAGACTQNGHQAGGQQPCRAHCIFPDLLLWAGKTTIVHWVRSYDSTWNNIPVFPSCWLIRGQSHGSEKIEDNSCLMLLSSQVMKKDCFL